MMICHANHKFNMPALHTPSRLKRGKDWTSRSTPSGKDPFLVDSISYVSVDSCGKRCGALKMNNYTLYYHLSSTPPAKKTSQA